MSPASNSAPVASRRRTVRARHPAFDRHLVDAGPHGPFTGADVVVAGAAEVAGGADAEPLTVPAPMSTATAATAASGAMRSGRAGMGS